MTAGVKGSSSRSAKRKTADEHDRAPTAKRQRGEDVELVEVVKEQEAANSDVSACQLLPQV